MWAMYIGSNQTDFVYIEEEQVPLNDLREHLCYSDGEVPASCYECSAIW